MPTFIKKLCDSQRRSVCYLQAYQGSMSKHTVCFTDLCSQIGIVLQTVAILGWRAPTFSYQFSSQYFIICQLYSFRHLELQDIYNALVIMLDKVKITPELWSVIHVLKECEFKNSSPFSFDVIWYENCCPIYSFTTQYLK